MEWSTDVDVAVDLKLKLTKERERGCVGGHEMIGLQVLSNSKLLTDRKSRADQNETANVSELKQIDW